MNLDFMERVGDFWQYGASSCESECLTLVIWQAEAVALSQSPIFILISLL